MLEFAENLQHSRLSIALQSETWLTPTLQAIHILMIGIVFGSMLLIALRVLGRMRADEPFAAVWARFAPWIAVAGDRVDVAVHFRGGAEDCRESACRRQRRRDGGGQRSTNEPATTQH